MCSQLEEAGIRCWIAPRDGRPGRSWGSEIIRGLDNAKVMIVVLSASSNRSLPVIKEVERAFDKGIVIIPVRMEEVVPSEALEFFLCSEHSLDAITPTSRGAGPSARAHGPGILARAGMDRGEETDGVRRASRRCGAAFRRDRGRNSDGRMR